MKEYLSKQEIDLYKWSIERDKISNEIKNKKKELAELHSKNKKYSLQFYWKKIWMSKQAVSQKLFKLKEKVDRLNNIPQ